MAHLKRKRSPDDEDLDIASALTGTRNMQLLFNQENNDDDDDDDGLGEFIHDAIAKRDVKGGTHLLKKIKSKGNAKGDVGGGSFQSMGLYTTPTAICPLTHTQVSIRNCSVRSLFRVIALRPQSSVQPFPPFLPLLRAILSAWLAPVRERLSRT